MESKIEDFNWNLRCFLDALNNFGNDVGLGDNMTSHLLTKAHEAVGKLTDNLQFDHSKNANDVIMCSMDSKHFEMRRSIYCCRCKKSLPATRRDYLLHSADSQHHIKLIEHANLEKSGQTNEPAKKSLNCDANNNKTIKMPPKAAVNHSKPKSLMEIDTSQIESLLSIEQRQLTSGKTGDSPNKKQPNIFPNACTLSNNMAAASPQNLFKPQENEIPEPTPMAIPNVFDDNIYEFLETRKKQQNVLPSKPVEPVKSVWQPRSASTAVPSTSTNIVENWRDRTNATTAPGNVNRPKPIAAFGSPMKPVNGVESLYSQFPHLDPNKVKNPFEATPMTISDPSTNKNSTASQPHRKSDGLDKLAEMLNRKNEPPNQQTPPLFGSLFSTYQQSNKAQPGPISPPNSFQPNNPNIDPNMVLAGMHPYNPLFNDRSLHCQQPNMMFQHFPNNMPPGYGILGPYPSPWSHPASGSPLMQQFPKQTQLNPHPNNSKLVAMKKNNLSNSVSSLPATFNGQTKKQHQEQKNGPDNNRGRASSVIDMDTGRKSNGANAKENETKRKSSPAGMTEFFAKDLSARITFISKSNSTFGRNKTADLLMKQVIALLDKKFNNKVECRLIGSRAYETAIDNNTPVDIYLDLLDSFNKDKSGGMFVNAMMDVQTILGKNNEWSDVKCSEQTRYGVLSATNTKLKLKCLFRFGTGVAVRNSEVIKCLFEAQPVCRQLVICVRLLMQEMKSSEGNWLNKFNGYIVTLMVIFYFQVNKKLPSVCSLQAATTDREQCGENNVAFSKPKDVAICKDRLRTVLMGFFEFYKNFQYDRKIISPFEGHEIAHAPRNSNEKSVELKTTMIRFRKMVSSGPQKWVSTTLCIQDIFEHKNNAGYSVKSDDIRAFKYFCTKALNGLQANGDLVKY